MFLAKLDEGGYLSWVTQTRECKAEGYGVCLNHIDGSILVTGYFNCQSLFGHDEPNETSLSSLNNEAMFIAKYDPDGYLVWAKQALGENSHDSDSYAYDIALNHINNTSVVVGDFDDVTHFGPGEPNQTTLYGTGGRDCFVSKYDADGSLMWVKQAGWTNASIYGYGVDLNPVNETIIATGYFYDDAVFGKDEPNETTLSAIQNTNMFVAKYSSDGSLQWARQAGDPSGVVRSNDSAIFNADNSAIITGWFLYDAIFGLGEPNETVLSSSTNNIFIAKYNTDGSLAWAKQAAGNYDGESFAVSVDQVDGTAVISGEFTGLVVFGQGEPNETSILSTGNQWDFFLAKYAADGSLIRAYHLKSTNWIAGLDVAINSSDHSTFVTGYFKGGAQIGMGNCEPNGEYFPSVRDNMFVVKYKP